MSLQIEPRRASLVYRRTSVSEPKDERFVSRGRFECDKRTFPKVLAKLLYSVRASLACDGAQAEQFIACATTLIRAEVERGRPTAVMAASSTQIGGNAPRLVPSRI